MEELGIPSTTGRMRGADEHDMAEKMLMELMCLVRQVVDMEGEEGLVFPLRPPFFAL